MPISLHIKDFPAARFRDFYQLVMKQKKARLRPSILRNLRF